MGQISGWIKARCKVCKCVFTWYQSIGLPFVDSEIIGTCDKCIVKENHDCINEYDEKLGRWENES